MKILSGGKIVLGDELLENKAILFDSKIRSILSLSEAERADAQKIHYTGTLLPGFIDIHIHGAAGADTMDASFEALDTIAKAITRSGTTSFLATTMTMPQESITESLDTIRGFMREQKSGAQCLGAHLEGPFINPAFKGAQSAQYIQTPTREWIAPYLDIIKVITMAPEMDEEFALIRSLKEDVVLSIGHSSADYDTAAASFKAGISHVTHCFNAMTGLHHRSPGIVGAALVHPVSVDLITDLVHVHPDLFPLVIKQKGPEKFLAITDAMRAAFLEEGIYDLGGQSVTVKDNTCRLEDGTIAGSVHRMDLALKNLMEHTDNTLPEISQMLSTSAAKLLKIDHLKGHIQPGYDADLVVADGHEIKQVFVGGEEQ